MVMHLATCGKRNIIQSMEENFIGSKIQSKLADPFFFQEKEVNDRLKKRGTRQSLIWIKYLVGKLLCYLPHLSTFSSRQVSHVNIL